MGDHAGILSAAVLLFIFFDYRIQDLDVIQLHFFFNRHPFHEIHELHPEHTCGHEEHTCGHDICSSRVERCIAAVTLGLGLARAVRLSSRECEGLGLGRVQVRAECRVSVRVRECVDDADRILDALLEDLRSRTGVDTS